MTSVQDRVAAFTQSTPTNTPAKDQKSTVLELPWFRFFFVDVRVDAWQEY